MRPVSHTRARKPGLWTARWILTLLLGLVLASSVAAACTLAIANLIDRQLVGDYYLSAVERKEELTVVYRGTDRSRFVLTPSPVVDVGWNDRYTVVAVRIGERRGGEISYFYIDTQKPPLPADLFRGVVGPLKEDELQRARTALALPQFTVHYPELR